MKTLLDLKGVTAFYGASQALFGIDLDVAEGEVVALMGRNGMGKTTTVRTVSALLRPREGAITFAGHATRGMAIHRVARLGIGLVPEGRRCFAPLSVEENLTAAARASDRPGGWTQSRVEALFPRLAERRSQRASTLSGGEQQMLAIGRALMTNPRLLVLDEATEGLAPVVRQEIWAAIHQLKGDLAILVIDKTLKELRQVADRCFLIERGRTVWTGAPAALTPELTDRYLGV
jgi:branched-chain amino acid transport system ATP-binding protein